MSSDFRKAAGAIAATVLVGIVVPVLRTIEWYRSVWNSVDARRKQ